MTVTEKVAYLKGLTEGLGIDDTTKEGKVIKAMIDILDDIAFSVSDLEDGFAELCDQVDLIDEDLDSLEEDLYGDDEDFDEDEDEDDEDFDLDEDEDLYEVTCPSCGDTIYVNETMLDEGHINCPNCSELLEFEFDEDDCDCDCESCKGE